MLFLKILFISAPVMRTVVENEEYNFRCDDVVCKATYYLPKGVQKQQKWIWLQREASQVIFDMKGTNISALAFWN